MTVYSKLLTAACLLLLMAACVTTGGCGSGADHDDVKLAKVKITVTYKGSPMPNVNVMAQPEKGPLATGVTDGNGVCELKTAGKPGCAIGTVKFGVSEGSSGSSSAPAAPTTEEEGKKYMEMMRNKTSAQGKVDVEKPKTVIDSKYSTPTTSGWEHTVESGKDNEFTLAIP